MSIPTEREEFEAWANTVWDGAPLDVYGNYFYPAMNSAWAAWQARASQVAAPPAPPDEPLIDGYPLWSGIPQPVSQEPPQDTFGFLDAVFNYAFEAVDLNGADIQEMGVKYGLLKEVQATEPCRDDCDCASVTDFPTQCYRTTY